MLRSDFRFTQSIIASLEMQIINAFQERNKRLPAEIKKILVELKEPLEKLTLKDLKGKKLEVYIPLCISRLFELLREQLGMSVVELITAYRVAAEMECDRIVGKGNYVLYVLPHFLTEEETNEFWAENPGARAVARPIEEWRLEEKYQYLYNQIDELAAKYPEQWQALETEDFNARKTYLGENIPFLSSKGMSTEFNEADQRLYRKQLLAYYWSFMVTKNQAKVLGDEALIDNPIGLILTNDAHADAIYKFAEAHFSELKLPAYWGANGFAYVNIHKIEHKPKNERKVYLDCKPVKVPRGLFGGGSDSDTDSDEEKEIAKGLLAEAFIGKVTSTFGTLFCCGKDNISPPASLQGSPPSSLQGSPTSYRERGRSTPVPMRSQSNQIN